MKEIFFDYITMEKELESKGGRESVVENPSLEPLYEKILNLEDEILKRFGLPKLLKFREIIWDLSSETDIEGTTLQLKNAATYYLISSPEKEIELLEEAKINDLRTYEVLPEIGVENRLHSRFYFEEYFKKGIIDAKELINILKSIDEDTASQMGLLNYYKINGENPAEAEEIYKELKEKHIPYLEEFILYKPVYPY